MPYWANAAVPGDPPPAPARRPPMAPASGGRTGPLADLICALPDVCSGVRLAGALDM